MNPLLNIKSIRIKNLHIDAADPSRSRTFASINQAKAESRRLGGYTSVRAFKNAEAARPLLKQLAELHKQEQVSTESSENKE